MIKIHAFLLDQTNNIKLMRVENSKGYISFGKPSLNIGIKEFVRYWHHNQYRSGVIISVLLQDFHYFHI